jgi:hypothetical protein
MRARKFETVCGSIPYIARPSLMGKASDCVLSQELVRGSTILMGQTYYSGGTSF